MTFTTARYVTTVEDFTTLLNDAMIGLLPKARKAIDSGGIPSIIEFVRPQAGLIASVTNIESDELLSHLISRGYRPSITNATAERVVCVELSRRLVDALREGKAAA